MSPHHFHSIFHCKVTVGSSGAIMCRLVQLLDNCFLHINGESSPCAEFGKAELMLIRQFYFLRQLAKNLVHVCYIAKETVFDFGDNREQRHFI